MRIYQKLNKRKEENICQITKTVAVVKKAPFRLDHVGSFLRPERLKEARAKFNDGEITAEELERVENEEIIALIEKEKRTRPQVCH